MYFRLSSTNEVFEKMCSSSVLGSQNSGPVLDVVLVDASQLLYHVVWPVDGTAGYLALIFGVRLGRYPPEAQKRVLFDRYYEDDATAKDHERMRRTVAGTKDFHLTPNTPLLCREAILKNSKSTH